MIEITPDRITIKSRQAKILESIAVTNLELIALKDPYALPYDSIQYLFHEFQGRDFRNYLIIRLQGKERRFDFVLD